MADMDPMVVAPADGVVRGDMKAMPNRGTSVGFTGVGDDRYGASVDQGATNRMGSAYEAPDPMDACCPPGGGDRRARANHPAAPGRGMGGAADSDEMMDTTPSDEGMPGDTD